MGKKDKRVDQAKLQAKKARQAAKQEKTSIKRTKKELKDVGEEDIEKIIAEFAAKDAARLAVTVSVVPQPSRRANFSMTALPNGELLLFGGECCDGERTEVYNELFRWNVEKNEWKMIESLNTPPPRCSHQAVIYHDKLYMFGGEYATMDQFYHYRDFWELDLKTNAWTEVEATGDLPSARSGHRMIVWRNYLIMFGGFYEAMREVRWFNDLYIFSFQTKRWTLLEYKANTQVPKPRSGVQMSLHSAEDIIYIYGGYSKEKSDGARQEGKIHEDMWMLNLKPCLPSGKSTNLELTKAIWQKISRKGDYPSSRCGAVMTAYKNKGVLFGGVYDTEGPRHSLISTFYNDLYAFDMERKRWYKLGLKQKKVALTKEAKAEARKLKIAKAAAEKGEGSDEEISESDDEVDEDEENEIIIMRNGDRVINAQAKNDLFGYIDENGNVVYLDIEDEADGDTANLEEGGEKSLEPVSTVSEKEEAKLEEIIPIVEEMKKVDIAAEVATQEEVSDDLSLLKEDPERKMDLPQTEQEKTTFFGRYFDEQTQPCPRINPCIMTRGNTLYVYGGVTEIGDVEITLDDCWTLDLNKRDEWKRVLPGTMASIVWKGADDEDESSRHTDSVRDDDDDDDDDSDDDDDDDDSDSDDSGSDEEEKPKEKKEKKSKNMSRKEEMETLRAHFDTTDAQRTPLSGETLRDFYSRTAEYWAKAVVDKWEADQKTEPLTEKEIKRQGFQMAEVRYQELLPLLSRLNELESDQRQDEQFYEKKEKNRGGGGGGDRGGKHGPAHGKGGKEEPKKNNANDSKKGKKK